MVFNRLKVVFTASPVLSHPDPARQFVLEVDMPGMGVGAVLSYLVFRVSPVSINSHVQ